MESQLLADLVASQVGATFRSVDLHVHTGASEDVDEKYGDTAPDSIVNQALAAGLDAIAITDHNTVEGYGSIKSAASETPLTVLPGVEISTPEGHLLAIFDVDTSLADIKDMLVRIGFSTQDYGRLDVLSKQSMEHVAQEVVNLNGLAIPAHIDREKGIYHTASGLRRQQLLQHTAFAAFEIVDLSKRENILATAARSLVFVQGSDGAVSGEAGHRLAGIGSRFTRIKAGQPTLRAIKHAINDPSMRVRLRDETLMIPEIAIESLKVNGGFLDGLDIRFSRDVNCLIGGTGTGKSLTIELIRFCLDQQSTTGTITKEVQSRL